MSDSRSSNPIPKEFLSAESMLTPGIAGSLTMLITNTLAAQFALPPNWTGLGLSFLFGLIVFWSTSTPRKLQKFVLYVLNSLIIFSVALGSNQAAVSSLKSVTLRPPSSPIGAIIPFKTAFFSNWLDGTVPLRMQLLSKVAHLDDAKAQAALTALAVKFKPTESPEIVLTKIVSSARTKESVVRIETAVKAVESRPR
jgi:hypothetical protein